MKSKLILLLIVGLTLLSSATKLKREGWNLISVCQDINTTDINMTNLEEIQSQDGKSMYTQEWMEYSNLEILQAGYGYWVKGKKGTTFNSGVRLTQLVKPLRRTGWNLMASCENIPQSDINMTILEEIQSQDGQTLYSGNLAQYSNLDFLLDGYGYWVKGLLGTEFIAKRNLSIPSTFEHHVINNKDEFVELAYEGYTIRLYTDYNQSVDSRVNHVGIVIEIDGNITVPTMNIQESYRGHNIVIGVYNGDTLVGVSGLREVSQDSAITVINVETDGSRTQTSNPPSDTKDREGRFQGLKIFAIPLNVEDYGLATVTDDDFNALSLENKRIVANKLFSLLFYGVPKMELDSMLESENFISSLHQKLATSNSDIVTVEAEIAQKDYYWRNKNAGKILARLFNMKLGKEYLNRWVAYQLTQTILFSPAFELDTVQSSDIKNIYNNLVFYMDDEYSMQMITYLHMISNDNWKRFRSPEDNGREMLEIFLFDFNDSHVPMAATALKNWKLDKSDNELVIGLDENSVPQSLFGTTVTTGFDFYRELINSDAFLNGVIKRLVKVYFGDYTQSKKAEILNLIKSSQPEQFQDILLQIIFSKEFLYHSTRIKSFEESAFHIAKKIDFFDSKNYFYYMGIAIDGMHQGSMKYKLGRDTSVPTDTLSFAYYYEFLHKRIMVDYKGDTLNDWDAGWQQLFIDKNNPKTDSLQKFVEYLFLATISRLPTEEEKNAIVNYCNVKGYDDMSIYNDRRDVAIVTMEYLSRLSEIYTFKSIEE